METRGRAQDENRDESGDEINSSIGNRNGKRYGDGNEYGIGEGGGEAKKRQKPHKSCKRDAGNEDDLCEKRNNSRQENVW